MGLRKRLIDRLGPKEGWHIVAARYANERDEAWAVIAAVRGLWGLARLACQIVGLHSAGGVK